MHDRIDERGAVESEDRIEDGHVGDLPPRVRRAAEIAAVRQAQDRTDADRQDDRAEIRGRRPAAEVEQTDQMIGPATAVVRRDDAEGDPDDNHEEERGDEELDGRREEGQDHREDGGAALGILPPVSLEEVRNVVLVLIPDRLVHAEVLDAALDRVRARVGADPDRAWVPNRGMAREERDRDESEEDRDEPDDPLRDEDSEIDLAPTHSLSSPRPAGTGPTCCARTVSKDPLRARGLFAR